MSAALAARLSLRSTLALRGMAPKRAAAGAATGGGKRARSAAAAPAAAAAAAPEVPGLFLLKSEPDVFSIADLAARGPGAAEPWDGVRSHAAKAVLRSMRRGDRALFYHSNQKPQPAVVGVVEVVREAYPDPSQFDEGSEYYDARSTRENPTWVCVDVALAEAWPREEWVTLARLKAERGGALAGMPLFAQPRLSVSRVSAAQWAHVTGAMRRGGA